MKKTETPMRAEYKRGDFAQLERGKFFKEASKSVSVVLIAAETVGIAGHASKPARKRKAA